MICLGIVVAQRSAIFELLTSEDESLLIWRDTFFILDLGFNVFDGVTWLYLECDGLASQRLYKDLHS